MSELGCHRACLYGKLEDLKAAVAAGDDPRALDASTGSVPIHWAARGGHPACIAYLVEQGLNDVNARNVNGNTPLHYACTQGRQKVAEALVGLGAELNPRNKDGKTPLHEAVACGWDNVTEFLLGLRGDKCGACERDTGAVCLKHRVDVNARDENGTSILHLAGDRWTDELYNLLVKYGADENVKDQKGQKPMKPSQASKLLARNFGLGIPAVLVAILAYLTRDKWVKIS